MTGKVAAVAAEAACGAGASAGGTEPPPHSTCSAACTRPNIASSTARRSCHRDSGHCCAGARGSTFGCWDSAPPDLAECGPRPASIVMHRRTKRVVRGGGGGGGRTPDGSTRSPLPPSSEVPSALSIPMAPASPAADVRLPSPPGGSSCTTFAEPGASEAAGRGRFDILNFREPGCGGKT